MDMAPIERDPDRHSGAAVFGGTRVPVDTLFHYLAGDDSLREFLAAYPTVGRDQVLAVLELAKRQLTGTDDSDGPIHRAD